MSFITTDYSNLESKGYEALPTGEYEIVIAKAMETATPSGAESLQLDLIVRNDLINVPALATTNGKFSNRHVFMDNWKRKNTGQYDTASFMYILQAVGVPEGTPVNSVDDFIRLITGRPARVYIKKEVDSYNTTDQNNPEYRNAVAPWNFSTTKFMEVNHTGKQPNQPQQQQTQQQAPPQQPQQQDGNWPF
ncbi:single-stranded DNA-binding protein [Sporosarcina sp. P21c]|uniref:DUF669 domain-containing protein n=1 Tax=Sporosarcina sp. P21c TaxID=2048255 RepID=UPI000C1644AA|nr:DUF669 domain-containing protein [Sporosarcina sp. P21c]PIC88409.1 single-stranded DNA-binding protein [Sporosarcina sp. P21c]